MIGVKYTDIKGTISNS